MDDESKDRQMNGEESQDRPLYNDKQSIQSSRSFKGCETFCNRLRRSNPALYQKLVQLTTSYASKSKQSVMQYHQELRKLFYDYSDIVTDVNKLLYADARILAAQKPEPVVQEPQQRNQYYFLPHISSHSILQSRDIKNELTFFEQFRAQVCLHFVGREDQFNVFFTEFMKVLSLYTDCVISHYDFMELLNAIPWLDKEVIDQLCIITMSRAQARRSNTVLFKPLKDTDFKQAERVTRSYVRMHPGYANNTSSPTQNTNQLWVSVPFGSEDYSFQIMRKNTYEEQLFKIEDEKYEFDWNTLCYKRCIKLLNELSATTSRELQETLVYKILNLKVLQSIYKSSSSDQHEIINLLERNPRECAQILRERVQHKCDEIVDTRNQGAQPSWYIVQMNNFHRSLDHRSFYFKKNEKSYTCSAKFLKEPEERFRTLQQCFYPEPLDEMATNVTLKKKNQEERPQPFKLEELSQFLNSFAQLTTYQPLSSEKQPQMMVVPSRDNFVQQPIFNLYLAKQEILIETFLYLIHYSQTASNFNQSERTWMFRFFIQIAHGYFNLQLNPYDFGELITNEQTLKNEVLQIEQTIFDANFSYLQSYQTQPQENDQGQLKGQKHDSTSPNNDAKEQCQEPMESESESQLSKMLSASPSQTEQDVYTASSMSATGAEWVHFFPCKTDDPHFRVFYASSGLYLFFRYFYTIYQRLEIAKEISFKFDSNAKTEGLGIQERYILGVKRYKLFKSALFHSLGTKEFKYEDYLRSIYAKQAFLFSTMEKLFQDCCKQLASLQNDKVIETQLNHVFLQTQDDVTELLSALLGDFLKPTKELQQYPVLFRMNQNISEDMQFALLTHSIIENVVDKSEKSIFRFAYVESDSSQMTINYIPTWGPVMDRNQLQKTQFNVAHYLTMPQSRQRPFLKRNIAKKNPKTKLFGFNELEFCLNDNAEIRLFNHSKEDVLINRKATQPKKKPHIIKNHVRNSLTRLLSG